MIYVINRILATIPVVLVVAVIVFLLSHLSPGDPAALIAGDYASADRIAQIHEALGLDQPLWRQFIIWFSDLAHGDMGVSVISQTPVSELLMQRIGPTASIAILTTIISIALSIPLGVLAAHRAGSWVDRVIMLFSVLAFSVPVFLVGYLFIYGFGVKIHWFPTRGYVSLSQGVIPWLHHLILPCLNLAFVYTALLSRITRATMLDVLNEDYIRTAKAKGLSVLAVLRHALRNAAVPVVTTIGTGIALMFGGVVITETVFAIPGVGRLVVNAVLHHDYPVIQGVLLVSAICYVFINLLTDLSYSIIDPRIRY